MENEATVVLERRGPAFWIALNRPERRNALTQEMIRAVREGLRRAHADGDVRVIVLTGRGAKAFCAGADLAPGGGFAFDPARPSLEYADLLRDACGATLPIVARVNGACVAGGMGLLCAADLAIAASHATFGLPEVKVGVFPMQVMSLLQQLVPPRIVREWCLTGQGFDAATALRHGLLNQVVPAGALDEATESLIASLADRSPTAIRRGKYALRAMEAMSLPERIAYTEGQIQLLTLTEDAREGMAAFNEKRPPRWTGR
jgi:enoyl-CoA hydratase/carnithine racemase